MTTAVTADATVTVVHGIPNTPVDVYANALPAAAIFGQQVSARLVIVSCGGPFDAATGHYLENIVAYAVPAGGH